MSKFRADLNMVVLKGDSFSQSGVVTTLSWESLEKALHASGWLRADEGIEKIRIHSNGMDIFLVGLMHPSNEIRTIRNPLRISANGNKRNRSKR